VVDKAALGQVFSEFFGFPLSILSCCSSPCSYIPWGMNSRFVGGPQLGDIVSAHRHEQQLHGQNGNKMATEGKSCAYTACHEEE
jgi:hypothetical protein